MSGEVTNISPESEPKLVNCKRAIHDIVQHGEYIDATKVQSTELIFYLESAKVEVYDLFSYYSGDGGPAYGASISYVDQAGKDQKDWLGFVGWEEEALVEMGNKSRRPATDEDIAMFDALLSYVHGSLGKAPQPAETWRGDAEHLKPLFE